MHVEVEEPGLRLRHAPERVGTDTNDLDGLLLGESGVHGELQSPEHLQVVLAHRFSLLAQAGGPPDTPHELGGQADQVGRLAERARRRHPSREDRVQVVPQQTLLTVGSGDRVQPDSTAQEQLDQAHALHVLGSEDVGPVSDQTQRLQPAEVVRGLARARCQLVDRQLARPVAGHHHRLAQISSTELRSGEGSRVVTDPLAAQRAGRIERVMPRSSLFADVSRALRIALWCEREGLSTSEGLERAAGAAHQAAARRRSRREVLAGMARLTAAGAVTSLAGPVPLALARRSSPSVGIVGAGLAGLACGDTLRTKGIVAALYDASTRSGGRCHSLRGFFPGQVAERGGEFIDNLHKTMLGYARRFGLATEDVSKQPGEVTYFFGGEHRPEAVVVDEFRDFVAAMRVDLRTLSAEVTAADHTEGDVALDRTSLLAYLEGQNGTGLAASPVVKEAIVQAYIAEYGLAPDEQSCLNFLLFIHADRRSKFTPFGVFSDERWHVVDGNDRIAEGLARGLDGQIEPEMQLVRLRAMPSGRFELTFRRGGTTLSRVHDVVVLAIPFTTLRDVELDANLGFPPATLDAIRLLGYGTNAKMMVGFSGRPWAALGSTGASYSDLSNHQTTWETNPSAASATRAVLTDYSGAARGAGLDPMAAAMEAERFLADLDLVYPGAAAAATRVTDLPVVHLEHWPSNPLTKGSYTCYLPGQFTSIAGIEGMRVGHLHFAGEHANSFYESQGFMEGAVLSGIDAATEILRDARRR